MYLNFSQLASLSRYSCRQGSSSLHLLEVQFNSVTQSCLILRPHRCQASLFFTNSRNLLKLMFIESVMPFNHLILCRPSFSHVFYLSNAFRDMHSPLFFFLLMQSQKSKVPKKANQGFLCNQERAVQASFIFLFFFPPSLSLFLWRSQSFWQL